MGYTQPLFNVRKVAGGYSVYPDGATTDDLTIYPNPTDTVSWLTLFGNSAIEMAFAGTTYLQVRSATVPIFKLSYTSPDVVIECPTADKNIFLKPTGTGSVKFGTYTAGAATDSTGYITILDSAGNARKLMVQA